MRSVDKMHKLIAVAEELYLCADPHAYLAANTLSYTTKRHLFNLDGSEWNTDETLIPFGVSLKPIPF